MDRGGQVAPARLLFAPNSAEIGGANRVLLNLLDHLPRDRFEPWSLVPGRGPLRAALRARGVRTVSFDSVTPARRGGSARQLVALVALAARWAGRRVDLLHAQGPLSYRLAALAIPAAARLCHFHAPPHAEGLRWAFRRRPDRLVACSDGVARALGAALGRADLELPVTVVRNAVDVERWRPGAAGAVTAGRELPPHQHLVLLSGSLGPHKGVEDFLALSVALAAEFPTALFVVAGEDFAGRGAYRAEMQARASETGLGGRIHFTGFLADPLPLVQSCALLVLPTRSEGLSQALLEAAACGKPVVAYDAPGVDEVVVGGRTGILVPHGDVAALAAAVRRLLGDTAERAAMGRAARDHVERDFPLRRQVEAMIALYDDALAAAR